MFSTLYGEQRESGPEVDFTAKGQFSKKWGWYESFYSVGDNNALNIDKVSKMKVLDFLTALSFKKELSELINRKK